MVASWHRGPTRRLLGMSAVLVLALVCGGCWLVPGQNPDRTAFNPFESGISPTTVTGLTEKWTYLYPTPPSGRRVINHPVVSTAGVHITADYDCEIVTLDAVTGAERWSRSLLDGTPDEGASCTNGRGTSDPFVDGDHVYVGASTVFVRAPPPVDPPVYEWVSLSGAFDITTGERDGGTNLGVIESRRGGVAAATMGNLYHSALPWREVHWAQITTTEGTHNLTIPDGIGNSATLGTDLLYDASYGPLATEAGDPTSGYGVRAYSLTETRPGCGPSSNPEECPIWATPIEGNPYFPVRPVIGDDGTVLYVGTPFFGSPAWAMYALDAATGAVRWRTPLASSVTAPPALAEGSLFVPTYSGDLVVLDADDGTQQWAAATGSAP